jgi:hypothetical protein
VSARVRASEPRHRTQDEPGHPFAEARLLCPPGLAMCRSSRATVEWKPALDMNRLTLQRAGVAIVALLVFRSIIRTLAKR